MEGEALAGDRRYWKPDTGGKFGRPGLTSSTQGRERRQAEPGAGRGRQWRVVGGHRRLVEEGAATWGKCHQRVRRIWLHRGHGALSRRSWAAGEACGEGSGGRAGKDV